MVTTIITTAQKTGHDGLSIYVPRDLRVDSQNPIQPGDLIRITVDAIKMTVEKIKEKEAEP